eukprot:6205947-Pleurochrysis_carterae.AAC.1
MIKKGAGSGRNSPSLQKAGCRARSLRSRVCAKHASTHEYARAREALAPSERVDVRASTSSMKMIDGDIASAASKSVRTCGKHGGHVSATKRESPRRGEERPTGVRYLACVRRASAQWEITREVGMQRQQRMSSACPGPTQGNGHSGRERKRAE